MARAGSNGRKPGGWQSGKRWRALNDAAQRHPLAAWARRYLDALLSLQFSPQTVFKRCQDLARFCAWCEERALMTPSELTRPHLERYQRHVADYRKADGKPLAATEQIGRLQSVQGWFRWLTQGQHVLANPAADLMLPRVPLRILPEPLTQEEIESALATLDPAHPLQLRDRTLWEVLYSTGLRRGEVVALQLGDVDRGRGTVFVRQGKGRKDRVVPIGERALAWVEKYLSEARRLWLDDIAGTPLFVNPDGSAVSPRALSHRARSLLKDAGITKPGACHLFRHSMATQMLEHGADVRYVQEMLGHAHLNTTQVYTHVSIAKLKAIHAATHPAAALGRKPREPDDVANGG